MSEDETIFGPAWESILAELIRDLGNEPSPSDEAAQ